jgi:hypothetical protein
VLRQPGARPLRTGFARDLSRSTHRRADRAFIARHAQRQRLRPGPPPFKQLGVDEEAVPEPLQEVKDQSGPAVEEPEAQDIPVEPIGAGAPEQRAPTVEILLQPAAAAGLVVEFDGASGASLKRKQVLHFPVCIAIVLLGPEGKPLVILVDDVVGQPQNSTAVLRE